MVVSDHKKRKTSEYSLDAVHRWARLKQVIYGFQRVQRDIENLGYSLDIVCKCLPGLQEQHYHESICYDDKQGWFDVYICSWYFQADDSATGVLDPLYIKLKLNHDCTSIILASFHR